MIEDFFKEVRNLETVKNENYFFMYKEENNFLHISYMYIKPEKRKGLSMMKCFKEMNEIKNNKKLKGIRVLIQCDNPSYRDCLRTSLRLNFHIVNCNYPTLFLELKDE